MFVVRWLFDVCDNSSLAGGNWSTYSRCKKFKVKQKALDYAKTLSEKKDMYNIYVKKEVAIKTYNIKTN